MPPTNQIRGLEELLTVLGCPRVIAPLEMLSFARRTGELIAQSTKRRPLSPRPRRLEIQRTYATRMLRQPIVTSTGQGCGTGASLTTRNGQRHDRAR